MRIVMNAFLGATMLTAGAGAARAQVVTSDFGSAVIQTLRNCAPGVTTPCNGVGQAIIQQNRVGGSNVEVNATLTASPAGPGAGSSAFASVNAAAVYGLPEIKASVDAVGNVRVGNNIYAYQTYTYRGDDEFDLLLNANFHIDDASSDGAAGTGPSGAIASGGFAVWDADDFFSYSDPYYTGTGNGFSTANSIINQPYLFGMYGCGDFTPENDVPRGPRATSGTLTPLAGGEQTIGIAQGNCFEQTLTLYKGDQFVIASFVQLIANRNGFIDATGTFTIGLDPAGGAANIAAFQNGVVTGLVAVPEPATWAMMIGGFGVVGGAARRRKALARA